MSSPDSQIIELDFVDSTNNYAMQLIDGNKAQHGLTIVANAQTQGKGQRGKTWQDAHGQSLLMSMVVQPAHQLSDQFLFNASVAVAIANVLQKLNNNWKVNIKWPNDIIINDKKAGGILIENVLRGSKWTHSVIGFGLNIKQESLPKDLPFATSLKIASGINYDVHQVLQLVRNEILASLAIMLPAEAQMEQYNALLYKRGKKQVYMDTKGKWSVTILNALANGTIEVQLENGNIAYYHHGQVLWDYGAQA